MLFSQAIFSAMRCIAQLKAAYVLITHMELGYEFVAYKATSLSDQSSNKNTLCYRYVI